MGDQQQKPAPLDYETIAKPPAGIYFGLGALAITLALTVAVITVGTSFSPLRSHLTQWDIGWSYMITMNLSAIGLAVGIVGLFQRQGKGAAVLGVALCLLNLGFIPALIH